ncbi:stabilizer of axonemal microtubules 2 [Dicentrarchus labrax]|uniref:stabilizer of axonemal microtubules 2 n=1 Tax=Dicentrarchus labrax TaxID=13489 RepID=UPI0021F56566|nr:stabilizer of axonemal microtubules 2 [Dicentrarchus labrax]
MHPKTKRQQNGIQQDPSTRKQPGPQRAKTRATMTTEYQDRFLAPSCHTTVVLTSKLKDPYHPLKGTSADVATFKSYYVTHKWTKHPPKAPQPSMPPKTHQRCSSAPHNPQQNPLHLVTNQMASTVEDYTSVYKNDFRAWKTTKRQPFKLPDSLKVNQGLVATKASKDGRSQKHSVQVAADSKPVPEEPPQPFESITSYRSDYVTHPIQPRTRRQKPVQEPNRGLPMERVSSKPKGPWDIHQQIFDEASEFFQQFKNWSLETKFRGQGKAKGPSPPAEHDKFLSTTHADYTAKQCQRTKPILPSMQSNEKSKEPFQATTTMNEDYKTWDIPRRFPTVQENMDWPKRTTFSIITPKPAESKTNPKPFSHSPKLNETAGCDSNCNVTHNPPCPAENGAFSGFECISNGTEESRRYWSTSLDKGVTWSDSNICEAPSEEHQIKCMVSSRS